jgi:RNA polymerase sigma-70 factor (ECF subfamily)
MESNDVSRATSPSLLLRVRDSDDQEAWAEFMQIYSPIVRDYCHQRNLQLSDIDDITQEVMASVSSSIRTFEYDPAKGKFRAWMGTVAANKIKTWLTRQSRRKENSLGRDDSDEISPVDCVDPDSLWTSIFSERIFRAACDRIRGSFADVTWQCFEATWVRSEPPSKVAISLNMPVHSVYVNKSRVLQRLEQEVQRLADDVPAVNRGFDKN